MTRRISSARCTERTSVLMGGSLCGNGRPANAGAFRERNCARAPGHARWRNGNKVVHGQVSRCLQAASDSVASASTCRAALRRRAWSEPTTKNDMPCAASGGMPCTSGTKQPTARPWASPAALTAATAAATRGSSSPWAPRGNGQVGRADEQAIDARHGRDGGRLGHGAGAFDLHDDRGVRVAGEQVLGHAAGAVAPGARGIAEAPGSALAVARRAHHLFGDAGIVHMRHHHPARAEVQRLLYGRRARIGHADQDRQRAGMGGEQAAVQALRTERRVLGVEHERVHPRGGQHLHRLVRGRLHEGRHQAVARQDAAAQPCRGGRTGRQGMEDAAHARYSGRAGVKTSRLSTGSSPTTTP